MLLSSAAVVFVLAAEPASARAQTSHAFNVPAQGLADALRSVGQKAGVNVVFEPAAVRGKRAPALRGTFSAGQALDQVLQGSGLSVRMTAAGSFLIVGGQSSPNGGLIQPAGGMAQADAPAASASGEPSQLEEIIVTAQKRSENVQDVPASVSVVSADRLAALNATQLSDFAGYVPGFTVSGGGVPGAARLTLRGIASNTSSTVATYIDDVPLGSSSSYGDRGSLSLDLFPYDVARVEVLRGPQGTLYGANSMGGLLKYASVSPDLNRFSARIGADAFRIKGGDDTGWGVRVAVNAPLVQDRLGLRASYFHQDNPGYIDNVATGEKDVNGGRQEGGRVVVLWTPTDDLSIKLSALHQSLNYDGGSAIVVQKPGLSPVYGLARADVLPTPYRQRLGLYNATIDWDLGGLDLTSSTSFARTHTRSGGGFTDLLGPFGILGQIVDENLLEKTTQELRLASPSGGTFEWLVGAFYTNEDYQFHETGLALTPAGVPSPAFNPLLDAIQPSTYREYALFGNATWRFNERFDVSAGLRWSRDKQAFSQTNSGWLFDPGDPTATTFIKTEASESVLNYMASARYHFTPDAMLYARVASGYRPGGPNVAFPGAPSTFDSDSLVNYEVGLKSEFFDRRALVDVSLFYIDWSDIQVILQTPTAIPYLVNAGRAVSQGIEFTSSFSPADGLTLGANFAFTDATISDTVPGLGAQAGDRIPNVPRWSGSLTAQYEAVVAGDLKARFNVGYRYTGDRYSRFNSSPRAVRLPEYGAIDASVGLGDERWTVRLYAKNLTDERGFQTDLGSAGGALQNISIIQPRTVGLALDASF
jgi:iron complex outermembrane receptor protein